ncbi:hypothetical protein ACH95_20735 [Bacillus glycinifermentans]|uniref:Uncharacterized protein n=1 Tax=Bacillus glycinifermentans TaxID=1664069 RepID=A0A0J6H745_9BACI|nr:hypothetical protein [Bacillus glycinifermentans]ATH92848.1 hypothetical protein COP00_09645 [Bacillus glycinifermentans]KMM53798.1 hypothetical protein ACH95_20735 [Bacillus glycinifermentans]KRT94636.1 hypothetical protein AB447_213325 [Bacillus glycinifermentans]MEC0485692.1 hypothetical protein [Bacillus glycinifermentans]MEC0493635.1 hypothetical protein [Bacillus glycinifermentans]
MDDRIAACDHTACNGTGDAAVLLRTSDSLREPASCRLFFVLALSVTLENFFQEGWRTAEKQVVYKTKCEIADRKQES